MNELDDILKEPLDTEHPKVLAEQLATVEAWQAVVSSKYRMAQQELAEIKNKCLYPPEKGMTVMDREIRLEADTARYKNAADVLGDKADIIKRRISLGQTILKNMRTEQESGL